MLLDTLRSNNLTANPTKCEYAFTEIEYLGYCISEKGIRMSPRKIEAIKAICQPTSRKSLQRALGLFNFWRKFIRDFAQQTVNMRQLLTKDAEFKWNALCQEELEYLKQCLINEPILQPINPNKDLVINTDASCTGGYSYVLMQFGDDNELHVVCYGAQAVTMAQSRYTPA